MIKDFLCKQIFKINASELTYHQNQWYSWKKNEYINVYFMIFAQFYQIHTLFEEKVIKGRIFMKQFHKQKCVILTYRIICY